MTDDETMTNDEMNAMPWTRDLMTDEQLRQWIASRKEAGCAIDIETCELGRWYAHDADPYGVRDLSPEMQQIGTNRFVRDHKSKGWVNEGDLPVASVEAMYDRLEREWRTHQDLGTVSVVRSIAGP